MGGPFDPPPPLGRSRVNDIPLLLKINGFFSKENKNLFNLISW